jgi:hypothetical protein
VAAITMSVFSKLPVEQELLSLPEFALGFQWGLCCSVFSFLCCVFCWSLFVPSFFFFLALCCLSFFDLRIMITRKYYSLGFPAPLIQSIVTRLNEHCYTL